MASPRLNSRSRCGVVIKAWTGMLITILKITVPLRMCTAMSEVVGVCVLINILDLVLERYQYESSQPIHSRCYQKSLNKRDALILMKLVCANVR